jgi:hypothetical protein
MTDCSEDDVNLLLKPEFFNFSSFPNVRFENVCL